MAPFQPKAIEPFQSGTAGEKVSSALSGGFRPGRARFSAYVKLVKFQGPFLWHHHDVEDELFLVVKGSFRMLLKEDGREREIKVGEGEFLIMPHGVEHKPVADEEVWVMLLEPRTTLNTGNVRNERTVATLQKV